MPEPTAGFAAVDPTAADPMAAAFFDVDNTIMIGASVFHFAKGLAARGFFSWTDLLAFGARQTRLRLRGESRHDMHNTRESALAFVAGKKVEEIVALGEEIYDEEMADKIWSGTHALAQQHIDAGRRVWLVTATPVELATIIAQRLHLTGALGTVAETVDGAYTGHLTGEVLHGQAKADAVRALAVREGLDLARCAAYSDSINDLPLLSLVDGRWRSIRTPRCRPRRVSVVGRSATFAPAERRPGSACRPHLDARRWPARSWPASPSAVRRSGGPGWPLPPRQLLRQLRAGAPAGGRR